MTRPLHADPGSSSASVSHLECAAVPMQHVRVRALLENALRYTAPETGVIDPASGYPYEGWNQDPAKGVFLRTFTQLTAIGLWIEVMANVASGEADTPWLSREQALARLARAAHTLRKDQQDPQLGAKGLLGNFLDLSTGQRLGPLTGNVDRRQFQQLLGSDKAEILWNALKAKGWLIQQYDPNLAAVARVGQYGSNFFDGPLAPFADAALRRKIMNILDQRVVMVVFGDNANLSTSVAKTIGALLQPPLRDRPEAVAIRGDLQQFLDHQQEGYKYLYDAAVGMFIFGWDSTRDHFVGWEDLQGKWQIGHSDYLVNEFRNPTKFVVLNYGLPIDAVANLGFKIKPYRLPDGRDLYALAPWEGSAFQALGLELSMGECDQPSWRRLLENVVDIEIDFTRRRQLPGFLSEQYTGHDMQYTGDVGIPEITVNPSPRVTDTCSLYTLGIAYRIAPDKMEAYLDANWPRVSSLFTEHGPWEGYNAGLQQAIRLQTSAHTLSLILGLLGTGSTHMTAYLEAHGLSSRVADFYRLGAALDGLAPDVNVFAWDVAGKPLQAGRTAAGFHVQSAGAKEVGIAMVLKDGVSLSGGVLQLGYRAAQAVPHVKIALKPPAQPADAKRIPRELFTHLDPTHGQDAQVEIPLPATPGLQGIKELVITLGPEPRPQPIDVTITSLRVRADVPRESR